MRTDKKAELYIKLITDLFYTTLYYVQKLEKMYLQNKTSPKHQKMVKQ